MSTENYFQIFRSAIARIYNTNGKVVGAGFLVSQQHLVTCAHVVTAALGIVTNTQDSPNGIIEFDFPLIAPGQKVKAKVVFWQPVNPGQSKEDIAGLQIEETLPTGVSPVQLVTTSNYWQHKFRIFGFPQGHDTGVWADGELRDLQATHWIQIEAIKVPGYQIEPGFSGSPIWDESLQGVVGMAVAAEKKREGVKAAFMMPTTVLVETWDFLNQSVQEKLINSSPSLSRVQEIKSSELNKRLVILGGDYEAVYNQLNYTENAESRNNLQRQLNRIEQEIKKLTSSSKRNDDFSLQRSFLSYLANRSSQEFELIEAIKNRDKSRLLVCIIHGDELQSHYKFLERMQNDFLPHVLDLDQNTTTIKIKKMMYSSEFKNLNELPKYLLMNLAKNFVNKINVSLEEINENLNKSSPMIVHTDLISDDWQKQGLHILNKLLEFWQDSHNQNTLNKEIIICICVKYIRIEWRWNIFAFFQQYRYQQINKKMRKHIQEFSLINKKYDSLSIVTLSELKAIGRADVENWADSEHTKKFVGEDKIQQLKDKIGDMFDKWQKQKSSSKIPMRYLADNLREILENFH
ncbi:serine protease [Dolichospermum sp. ST_con]|nr:serine protease [Dolichospermum sp. ST_con]MDD1417750.1 serine protease [Dolichospermum sp. ST_sed1]MDD1424072.1 serine protease [Dolichospermum sp. ST_sed9]MDD1430075.1 serine protease [Dolichospermum sp. ST_sed6]MDD1435475.1 serine protease [Dolichospermum sp. ST_sed10]MDD1440101.1 serine protease [Dolichospermum sp. ST_sed3]MDD1445805.1 serine protease [Dolichospermum sp. ST_sed8]MDD1453767.1 serine protease [Dolichospermum sp. ST_sed7]MDD1459986.1 serine protease [Dolichospermum sp. 